MEQSVIYRSADKFSFLPFIAMPRICLDKPDHLKKSDNLFAPQCSDNLCLTVLAR